MAGLLDANGGPSSIRFSLILTSIGIFILLLAAAFYIVVAAFSPEMEQPSWEAIGIFAVGIATVVTGIGYTKVQQKKVEMNGSKPT
jgi:uncharacterized membrane protein YidH (DUF202 family)